ncbi:unnamed protein product [Soboliphyme baturini]|uniref:Uncharacterized protein n=1 Tax=Soboliphyme baturini TaxID=241478 RepID=A0A3P8BZ20_9BILA|nr:unnamed protein product [Soboliphyme baturini]
MTLPAVLPSILKALTKQNENLSSLGVSTAELPNYSASEMEKRKHEYLRFGKRKHEYLRFGKRKHEYLRFAVTHALLNDYCENNYARFTRAIDCRRLEFLFHNSLLTVFG